MVVVSLLKSMQELALLSGAPGSGTFDWGSDIAQFWVFDKARGSGVHLCHLRS